MKNLTSLITALLLSVSISFGQEYDEISFYNVYQKDLALVQKDGLFGFIDVNGNEVVQPKYDEISFYGVYQKGLALVQKDGLFGFIDVNGNEVVEPKHNQVPTDR